MNLRTLRALRESESITGHKGRGYHMNRVARALVARMAPIILLLFIHPVALAQQLSPDEQALQILNSARKAFNEKNLTFARDRFREFLQKFGGHKEANAARFGLALALLETPEKDYSAALEPLQQLAGVQDFAERPFVLYYLGLAQRGLGNQALAQAAAKPQEAQQHRNTAQQRFEQAANSFGQAVTLFEARAKAPALPPSPLGGRGVGGEGGSLSMEWSARARCDWAEMLLRTNKLKEARDASAPFVSDATLAKSRYRGQGLYLHGYAAFLQRDYHAAGRVLSQLAPFNDPVFGPHTRYLLGRTHHLADERPEAIAHYDAVLAEYERQKKAAVQALQKPEQFKDNPDEKSRLEALTKNPPPEHVSRAAFYWAVLLCEDGKHADAAARFAAFPQQYPGSPLIPEAQLRLGFCQVQLKQFAEAMKTLGPLEAQQPRYADQVLWWIAKAHAGAADPNNPPAYEQALKTAIDTFRRAAERAGQLGQNDAEAKIHRGDILMELGDTQVLARQFKEAAATYQAVQQENALAERNPEALQRQATALHLAGMYTESDALCQRFIQQHGKHPLLPAVMFRSAENAYFIAVMNLPKPVTPTPGLAPVEIGAEPKRLLAEAIKRYQQFIEKYPEFPHVSLAKHGLALSYYRLGEYEKAAGILASIPQSDRSGELAAVPYLHADCLLRMLPTEANDAIAAARVQNELNEAIKLLESFLAAAGTGPQAPDAMLRLGHCHQRLAELFAEPQAKNQSLQTARQVYERLMQQFPQHALMPNAVFERAKAIASQGDIGGAINELNRFQNDPLKQAPVAPLAIVRLSTLHRSQNRAAEAVKLLEQCRAAHEAKLRENPNRHEVAILVRYHHGLAVKEAGKLADARGIFESIGKDFANRPEVAEANWRAGQCRKEEALAKIDTATKTLAKPGLKPEEINAANAALQDGLKQLRDTAQFFDEQANQQGQKAKGSENHLRMIYESAWCNRTLGQHEVEQTRQRLQAEGLKKLQDERLKQAQGTQPIAAIRPPEILHKAIPVQPAEQRARDLYRSMIATASDAPLSLDARLELAEMHAQRNEFDPAIQLLNQALEKDATPELAERLRLRLGACQFTKGDFKSAFAAFDGIVQNAKSPLAAEARYRAAECLLQQSPDKDSVAKAIQHLLPFRDQPPLQNIAGISDRALLRLGHAFASASPSQWNESRQACEILTQRFPQSPWLHEARYGIGWAWQNQKNYDAAVNAYTQVTSGTAAEVAARAQLQIGLCRLEQKRHAEAANALLVVPFTYDYPELSALALCEASRVFAEMKQPDQAAKLLEKVVKDHGNSRWAEVAKQRLAEMKGNGKKG